MRVKIFGCELLEDGDRPKNVAPRYGGICFSIICAFVRTNRLQSFAVHGENNKEVRVVYVHERQTVNGVLEDFVKRGDW